MDKGLKFFIRELSKDLDTGICEECLRVIPLIEVERNAGICFECVMKGEPNEKDS